jgi:predicted nucleotidyltransferase
LGLKVYEEIEFIVDKIKGVNGVVGVVLFGSYSRGDFEEGSDIDILVIFRNKKELESQLREVYKITSESSLFVQVIGLTRKELTSSPLLKPVMREGKIYYADEDVKNVLTPMHKPYALVTYSTTNLSPKERVVFAQKLEGRGKSKYRYDGLIQKLGGFRVGRGVLMVPLENLKTLTDHLEEEKINYVIRHVWA